MTMARAKFRIYAALATPSPTMVLSLSEVALPDDLILQKTLNCDDIVLSLKYDEVRIGDLKTKVSSVVCLLFFEFLVHSMCVELKHTRLERTCLQPRL